VRSCSLVHTRENSASGLGKVGHGLAVDMALVLPSRAITNTSQRWGGFGSSVKHAFLSAFMLLYRYGFDPPNPEIACGGVPVTLERSNLSHRGQHNSRYFTPNAQVVYQAFLPN
jgi:hypothetical protein